MTTFIAFLRAINVGGTTIIRMTDLTEVFVGMGYKDARTFIQSGNVVFSATGKEDVLVRRIEGGLKRRFGAHIPVVLRTLEEVEGIVTRNPNDGKHAYVMLLKEMPAGGVVRELLSKATEVDRYTASGREIYVSCEKDRGPSLFSNTWAERILGVRGTTRGALSLKKLVAFARA